MYAERFILETNVSGKLKGMPLLPANKKVEAIFLMLDDSDKKRSCAIHTQTLQEK